MIKDPNTLPPLPSPCKGICSLDARKERCVGCLRTPQQIKDWPKLDNAGRMVIVQQLRAQREALGQGRKRTQNRRGA